MKILKVLGVILLLAIVGIVGYYFYLRSSLTPTYQGEIVLDPLDEKVEVYFTEHGIPHIYADSDRDALYAFGYVHAQDRLWQMDLLRHVGGGRLSELFGEDLIDVDKFLRTVGIGSYAKKAAEAYVARNHESLPLVQAYLAGINSYIESNPKPLEHTILGLDIEPFTEVSVFESLIYMAFSFSNAHKTDPFLTELSAKLDSTYLKDLNIYHYPGEVTIPNFDDRYRLISDEAVALLDQLRVPVFVGSNSWVLSGSKTESGKVILANDPHIGFSQPSVWYEAHLITPTREYYGYHIAGSPFPPILHTPTYANGLTMFENDDVDFYVEDIHPEDSNVYRYKGEWLEMEARTETIKVKDGDEVELIVRSTKHGPVVSNILKEEPLEDVVSMYWVTTNFENYFLESISEFTKSKSLEELESAVSQIHGPGLNFMYGDTEGNVAWWAAGKLIQRRDERTSKTFYDGASGLDDPDKTYPFEKNPHSVNPPSGYVYSANNQPDTVDGIVYAGYYLPDDRGERITEIINGKDAFSVDDVKSMMLDSKSKMFENVKGIMLHAVKDSDDSQLLAELIKWDATFDQDDFRPVFFQKWIYEVLEHAMLDELEDELWESYKGTHSYKTAIEGLIKNDNSKWWDVDSTETVETRAQIIQYAFDESVRHLKAFWGDDFKSWKWGDGHLLTHNHAMGTALSFLNIGPFKTSGGNEVINNLGFTYTGAQFQTITFGPSTRRIVDFSDVRNNSWSILPTGQSGNYFSPYYADQAELYNAGEFRKMMMNPEEIKLTENKLVLKPDN